MSRAQNIVWQYFKADFGSGATLFYLSLGLAHTDKQHKGKEKNKYNAFFLTVKKYLKNVTNNNIKRHSYNKRDINSNNNNICILQQMGPESSTSINNWNKNTNPLMT